MIQPPRELFLQVCITSRCNLSCSHCYVDDDPRDVQPDLFAETIRQFAELRARLGVERAWVQLSGGEPLLHPKLPALVEQSASQFPTKILTNGTLIDAEIARLIAGYCESVQVSFDGLSDVHDRRRGQGSFDAAHSGLKVLRDAGVPVSARMTVGSDNVGCVESLFQFLEPLISAFHVSRVVPIGKCEALIPNVADYRRVIYRLYALRASNPKIGLREPFFGPLMGALQDNPDYCGCSAGISGLCVTETGDIYPCRRLPVNLGNVSETSLANAYFDHPLLHQLRARELSGRCGACENKAQCGGGRCVACAVTGDPLAADPGCIFA